MEFILAHKVEILAALLAIDALLVEIPAIKANSVHQLIVGILKSLSGK